MREVLTGLILGIIITICAYESSGERPKEFIRYLEKPLPIFKHDYDTYTIKVKVHKKPEDSAKACKHGSNVVGCATWDGNQCSINIDKDYDTFLHEARHCFEGAWHK